MQKQHRKNPRKGKKSIFKMSVVSLIIASVIVTTGTFAFAREAEVQNNGKANAYQTNVKTVEPVKTPAVVETPAIIETPAVVETSAADQAAADQAAADQAAADQAAADQAAADQAAADQAAADQAAAEQAAADQAAADQAAADQAAAEQAAADQAAAKQVAADQAAAEQVPPVAASNNIPEGAVKTTINCTAYTATGNATAVGVMPQANHTIAAWKGLPYGTKVYIPSLGTTFTVEDRGGAVSDGIIDIYMNTYNDCIQFGRQNLEAYIIY